MSSQITEHLITLLRSRSDFGEKKYGTTLDRTDLTIEQWLDHATEEALDEAGYLQCAKRDIIGLRAENVRLASENLRLRSMLMPFVEMAKTIELEAPPTAKNSLQTEDPRGVNPVLRHILNNPETVINIPASGEADTASSPADWDLEKEWYEPVVEPPESRTAPPHGQTRTYTARELAAALGCHKDSIVNYRQAGLVGEPVEGTGGHPHNPMRFAIKDMDALRRVIEERREAAKHTAGRSLLKANKVRADEAKDRKAHVAPLETPKPAARVAAPTPVPAPTFDTNEEGKYQAIEMGKAAFRERGNFYILRRTDGDRYDYSHHFKDCSGWDRIETWRLNGMGRWESTPNVPGVVGMGTGVVRGPMIGRRAG